MKDCLFTVKVNGETLVYDYDGFWYFIKKRLDPEVQLTYQPDPVNDTAEILIKRYKGQMVRPAAAQKVSPDRVY